MSKSFEIGERVIVKNSINFPEVVGREVTVSGPLELIRNAEGETWFGYKTDYQRDGMNFCPRPHYIKRKCDDGGPHAETMAAKIVDKVIAAPKLRPESIAS